MIVVVILLKMVMPVNYASKFSCVLYIGVIALLGASIYFFVASKLGLIDEVLGKDFFSKLKRKFIKKSK